MACGDWLYIDRSTQPTGLADGGRRLRAAAHLEDGRRVRHGRVGRLGRAAGLGVAREAQTEVEGRVRLVRVRGIRPARRRVSSLRAGHAPPSREPPTLCRCVMACKRTLIGWRPQMVLPVRFRYAAKPLASSASMSCVAHASRGTPRTNQLRILFRGASRIAVAARTAMPSRSSASMPSAMTG